MNIEKRNNIYQTTLFSFSHIPNGVLYVIRCLIFKPPFNSSASHRVIGRVIQTHKHSPAHLRLYVERPGCCPTIWDNFISVLILLLSGRTQTENSSNCMIRLLIFFIKCKLMHNERAQIWEPGEERGICRKGHKETSGAVEMLLP